MLLSERFSDALTFAAAAHAGQVRKGTDLPYIIHPLAVAGLVLEFRGDEDQAIAGLLHDVVEDCDVSLDALADRFGIRVAAIVEGCTDGAPDEHGRKAPWLERKERYLTHLEEEPEDTLLVAGITIWEWTSTAIEAGKTWRISVPRTQFLDDSAKFLWAEKALESATLDPNTLDHLGREVEQGITEPAVAELVWLKAVHAFSVTLKFDVHPDLEIVVEPNADFRKLDPDALEPDHPDVQAIWGLVTGAVFTLSDGRAGTIVDLRHKFVARMQTVLRQFEVRFPSADGFKGIQVDVEKEGGLDEIKAVLKERSEFVEQEAQSYETGNLPLAIFAYRVDRHEGAALAAARAGQGRVLDTPGPEGSHLTMGFKGRSASPGRCGPKGANRRRPQFLDLRPTMFYLCSP